MFKKLDSVRATVERVNPAPPPQETTQLKRRDLDLSADNQNSWTKNTTSIVRRRSNAALCTLTVRVSVALRVSGMECEPVPFWLRHSLWGTAGGFGAKLLDRQIWEELNVTGTRTELTGTKVE